MLNNVKSLMDGSRKHGFIGEIEYENRAEPTITYTSVGRHVKCLLISESPESGHFIGALQGTIHTIG
jgi:hypothetical protein